MARHLSIPVGTGESLRSKHPFVDLLRDDAIDIVAMEPLISSGGSLRSVLAEEIRTSLRWPAEKCSRQELMLNPGLAIGALAVVPEYAAVDAASLVPKDRPAVSISFQRRTNT